MSSKTTNAAKRYLFPKAFRKRYPAAKAFQKKRVKDRG